MLEVTMTRQSTSARVTVRGFTLISSIAAAFVLSTIQSPAKADENFFHIDTLTLPAGNNPLSSFDIGWVDPVRELYILADRSNNSLDVFSTDTDEFLFQIPTEDGTNGVVTAGDHQVWAGDNSSHLEVADLKTHKVVDSIDTGGSDRADELSFDRRDNMILIANDSDSPPFITFVSTKPGHAILGKITMDGTNGAPLATNGIEQSQWSNRTGLFYLNIPEVNSIAGNGEVLAIDPNTLSIVNEFPVAGCEPGGLALGPDFQALIGCSKSGTDNSARVIDIRDGAQIARFPQITAMDEVWYNPGDNHYFAAASNNPATNGGPELGIIDANGPTFDQVIPTGSGDHSVAAEPDTNHVFVPFKAGATDNTVCHATGCIVVFGTVHDDLSAQRQHEGGHVVAN
jgi:DNA-binding beta-propeller fold protein YncE